MVLILPEEHNPSVIVLDVMLPDIDGFEVCRSIREFSMAPIIMLTARGEDVDKIIGLEMGADDYMCKTLQSQGTGSKIKCHVKASFSESLVFSHFNLL
jgi:two-component system response regulator VicR